MNRAAGYEQQKGKFVTSTAAALFIKAYEDLCRERGLCLSHEDGEGGFLIEPLNDAHVEWVSQAVVPAEFAANKGGK